MVGKMIKIPEHVQNLVPYKAGKPIEELAREKGLKNIVKLASNENPLGPSPKALKVIQDHVNQLHRYTDPSNFNLVNAISKKINRDSSEIVCGSGSDSILQYIIAAFTEEGDTVLTSEGTFIGWYVNAKKLKRNSITIPLINYSYDLNGIINAIDNKTKIIYLSNPNNPTGTAFSKTKLEEFLNKVPDDVLVVLDEAYVLYAQEHEDYPNGLNYLRDNLIVVRTLSKSYGLAGLRIGYAVGPAYLIKELYKVKLPFEPNYLAEVAAIEALNDDLFLKKTVELNKQSLHTFQKFFKEHNIEYVPTYANFFLMLFESEEQAMEIVNGCLNKGLILRSVKAFGIPNGIRINSGTMEETEFAIKVLKEVILTIKNKMKVLS